jgi:hypothetical protein
MLIACDYPYGPLSLSLVKTRRVVGGEVGFSEALVARGKLEWWGTRKRHLLVTP